MPIKTEMFQHKLFRFPLTCLYLAATSSAFAAPACSVVELAPKASSSGVSAIGDAGQVAGWTFNAELGRGSTVIWRGLREEVYDTMIPTCQTSGRPRPASISAISPAETIAGTLTCDTELFPLETYWVKVKGQAATRGPVSVGASSWIYTPTGVSDAGSVVGITSRWYRPGATQDSAGVFAAGRSHLEIISPAITAQVASGNGGLTTLASGIQGITDSPDHMAYSGATWIDAEQAVAWSQSKQIGPQDTFLTYRSAARATWIAADEMGDQGSAVVIQNRLTGAETARFLPPKGTASHRLYNPILSASGTWLSYGERPKASLFEQTIYRVKLRNGTPQGSPSVLAEVFTHIGGITTVSDQGHMVAALTPEGPRQKVWYVSTPSGTVISPLNLVPGLSLIEKIWMNRRGEMAVSGTYNGRTSALRMTCTD